MKKVVNQHSDTKMLIVEINNCELVFFYDVFTIKFYSTLNHQDAFDDNKQIVRLFLSKNYKKK